MSGCAPDYFGRYFPSRRRLDAIRAAQACVVVNVGMLLGRKQKSGGLTDDGRNNSARGRMFALTCSGQPRMPSETCSVEPMQSLARVDCLELMASLTTLTTGVSDASAAQRHPVVCCVLACVSEERWAWAPRMVNFRACGAQRGRDMVHVLRPTVDIPAYLINPELRHHDGQHAQRIRTSASHRSLLTPTRSGS
jgi:hypothetical protein